MRLTDDDLRALEAELLERPEQGAVMAGTGGLRKMRFAPPSRHSGKRGAFRIGYTYVKVASIIYFLAIFPKNEQANLSSAEKKEAKQIIEAINQLHRR